MRIAVHPDIMNGDDRPITAGCAQAKIHSVVQIQTVQLSPPAPHEPPSLNPGQSRCVCPVCLNLLPMAAERSGLHIADKFQVLLQRNQRMQQMIGVPSDSSTVP